MIRKTRKVYFYNVVCSDNFNLREILFSEEIKDGYDYEGKTIEADYIQEENGLVIGTFVVTKTEGIPPKHKKRTREYSPIELEEDQGLVYPNVFLFDPNLNLFLMEFNRDGAYPSKVEQFFGFVFQRINREEPYEFQLIDISSEETYEKITSFDFLKKVRFKVAMPDRMMELAPSMRSAVKDTAEIADKMGSTKYMDVTFAGDTEQGGLSRDGIFAIVDDMQLAFRLNQSRRINNSLKIEGEYLTEDALRTSDVVDFFVDRLKGTFDYQEMSIQNSIYFQDRKRGILEVYRRKIEAVRRIFNIRNENGS